MHISPNFITIKNNYFHIIYVFLVALLIFLNYFITIIIYIMAKNNENNNWELQKKNIYTKANCKCSFFNYLMVMIVMSQHNISLDLKCSMQMYLFI